MTDPTSPPVNASSSVLAQSYPSRWASLGAWSRHPVAAGLALCAMVAVSFYPALSAGFVLDDNIFTESPAVLSWSGVWNIWFSPVDIEREGHYWPVTYTSFWLEHKLWGLTPFGTHLVNVLLYMVNVLLLWRLLRHLVVPGAWVVGALFAVHPMHVDSVAWAIGRKDLLSGLFYMAAALCWIRSMDGLGGGRSRVSGSIQVSRPGLYLAALGMLAAALLSKSVAVTLPVAFAIVLWWQNGRVTWKEAWLLAPFGLVALGITLADLSYYMTDREFRFEYGFVERILIAARALWYYTGKLVWPTGLAPTGPTWDIDIADLSAWGYLVGAVAVVALLWFGRHRLGRGPLAGALFFAVTLSPVLGFVDFSYMRISFVADRYAYLPGIGIMAVLIGAAMAVLGAAARREDWLSRLLKIAASSALVAVVGILGKLTWEQAGIYRDKVTFYEHIISTNPGAPVMHENLARVLSVAGRPVEALAASRLAVKQFPESVGTHNTLGVVLLHQGRLEEAADSFQRAREIEPDNKTALQNMGETRRRQGRFEESIGWYSRLLEIDPDFAMAHAGMGAALYRLGQYGEAVELLARAVALRPRALPLSVYSLFGDALRREHRHEDAIDTYRGTLESDPDYAPAHAGIGFALLGLKRYEEALDSLTRSVALQPEFVNADRHVAMGEAAQELGRTETAAEHYARAVEIDPENAKALDALALLRFRQQRYEDALRLFESLTELDATNAQAHVNLSATLHNLGRNDEALESLDRAFSLDPTLRTRLKGMRGSPRQGRQ